MAASQNVCSGLVSIVGCQLRVDSWLSVVAAGVREEAGYMLEEQEVKRC